MKEVFEKSANYQVYKSIFEFLPDPVIISDEAGTIKMINDQVKKAFGYKKEELIGQKVEILIPHRFAEKHVNNRTLYNQQPKARPMGSKDGLLASRKDGSEFPVDVSLSPIKFGTETLIVATIRDITEKFRRQEAIRQSEARLNEAQSLAKIGSWEFKIEENVLLWSDQTYRIFGIDKSRKLSLDIFQEHVHPDDREIVQKAYEQSLIDKQPYHIIHRVLMPDGTLKYVEEQCNTDFDQEGKPLRSIGTVQDITETYLTNLELAQKNQELIEKNKELTQITYIASHDLQEPLVTLTSTVNQLQDEYEDILKGNGEIYLKFLHQSANRMRELVRSIMDYSRIGQEKVLKKVDCNLLVGQVVDDLSRVMRKMQAEVYVDSLPVLEAYPTELRQLFQNLISNALKFRKPGVKPRIMISSRFEAGSWMFSVKDNGIGIKPDDAEKVFVIFKRLHNRSQYPGTGIGLAHCKKIVELHKGKIWVESQPGIGSTFYFHLENFKYHDRKNQKNLVGG